MHIYFIEIIICNSIYNRVYNMPNNPRIYAVFDSVSPWEQLRQIMKDLDFVFSDKM